MFDIDNLQFSIGCVMSREASIGFSCLTFLPTRASFSTTYLENYDRVYGLGTAIYLKIVVAVSEGILFVNYLCSKTPSLL